MSRVHNTLLVVIRFFLIQQNCQNRREHFDNVLRKIGEVEADLLLSSRSYTLILYPHILVPSYPYTLIHLYPLYPYTLVPLYPYTLVHLHPYTFMPLYPYTLFRCFFICFSFFLVIFFVFLFFSC